MESNPVNPVLLTDATNIQIFEELKARFDAVTLLGYKYMTPTRSETFREYSGGYTPLFGLLEQGITEVREAWMLHPENEGQDDE